MKWNSTDGLLTISIFAIYTELILAFLFDILVIGIIMVFITLAGIMAFYFVNYMKFMKIVAGRLCLSLQLFYSHDRYDISDSLLESYQPLTITMDQLQTYEESNDFLHEFENYIKEQKLIFPKEVKTLKSKYFYLELQKRIQQEEIDKLIKLSKSQKETTLEEIFREFLEALVYQKEAKEEMEKEEMKENLGEIKEEKEQIALEKYNEEIKKKKAESESEENKEPGNDNKIFKIIQITSIIILIVLLALVSLLFYDVLNQIESFIIVLVLITIFFIVITLLNKSKFQINSIEKETEKKEILNQNEVDVALKDIGRFFPYYHYTLLTFFEEKLGFKQCLVISPKSFFDSFHFSQSMIMYNNYVMTALTSPAVFEVIGLIEDEFPILLTKFCTGVISLDQDNLLNYFSIENARVRTYYRKLCDISTDYELMNDEVLNLRASRERFKKRLTKNKQQFAGELSKVHKEKNEIQEIMNDFDMSVPKKYYPLVWIMVIVIVINLIKLMIG